MRVSQISNILAAAAFAMAVAVPAHAATTVTIAWDPNPEPDITSYDVFIGTQPNPTSPLAVGNRTTWTFQGLLNGARYYFAVRARSSTGAVSPRSEISFVTAAPLPAGSEPTRSDFNGDGGLDIIWQHSDTSQLLAWHLNGAGVLATRFLTPSAVGAGWKLGGSGDFNRDGKPDLVFHNQNTGGVAFWLMDGAYSYQFGWFNPNAVDTSWQIAGVRDMNRDGNPDILWHQTATGRVLCWYLNGATVIATGWINANPLGDPKWKLGGVADFDRDGWADLLWHNEGTGQLLVWKMRQGFAVSGLPISPASVASGWKVAAIGDANRDGWADIFWQNTSKEMLIVWAMQGTTAFSGPLVGNADSKWIVAAPR
jgi:hypothetical protein